MDTTNVRVERATYSEAPKGSIVFASRERLSNNCYYVASHGEVQSPIAAYSRTDKRRKILRPTVCPKNFVVASELSLCSKGYLEQQRGFDDACSKSSLSGSYLGFILQWYSVDCSFPHTTRIGSVENFRPNKISNIRFLNVDIQDFVSWAASIAK